MYPLNGPQWSLFLEYIGNILYATIIHKFSKKWLSVFVGIAAAILIEYAVTCPMGSLAGGWSLNWPQLRIGFTRLLFPFFGGLLLYRFNKLIHEIEASARSVAGGIARRCGNAVETVDHQYCPLGLALRDTH